MTDDERKTPPVHDRLSAIDASPSGHASGRLRNPGQRKLDDTRNGGLNAA